MNRLQRIASAMPALVAAIAACLPIRQAGAQWSFTVDPTFQTQIVQQNVNDLVILQDGKLFISGRIRFPGDVSDRGSARLLPTAARDLAFPLFPQTTGGGKTTPWNDQYYVSNGLVRRLDGSGLIDPAFGSPNLSPCRYFNSVQGGDYHVYPDGRVLISGNHQLWDSIRGYVGRHQLIWLTTEGCLDTTRVHRTGGNCAVYRFKELPNGQFICSGTCNQFDGQEVDWIFRVNADGSVDTTFRTGVYIGEAADNLPLDDGRVYVAGNFRRTEAPLDTLRLVRFMSDGTLDPSFSIPQFSIGALPYSFGGYGASIRRWLDGNLLVTGLFSSVNGQPRGGICLLDTAGNVLPAFANSALGWYTFGSFTTASIESVACETDNAQLYVCGAYSGYNDGLTNYPQQRFITRLNVQELTTGVAGQAPPQAALQLWPNPSNVPVYITYTVLDGVENVELHVHDAQGRLLKRQRVGNNNGIAELQPRELSSGVHVASLYFDGIRVGSAKLNILR